MDQPKPQAESTDPTVHNSSAPKEEEDLKNELTVSIKNSIHHNQINSTRRNIPKQIQQHEVKKQRISQPRARAAIQASQGAANSRSSSPKKTQEDATDLLESKPKKEELKPEEKPQASSRRQALEMPVCAPKVALKGKRARKLPMIDFEEQDAYIKQMQQMQQYQQHHPNEPIPEGFQPPKKDLKKGKVIGNYILGRDLGKGTFGEVMVGTHSLTGEKVAIKVLEKEKIVDVHDVERVAREIHILKIVRHPTIVQLYEIIETNSELYLIMEYARGGELFEYIVSRKRVREKDACKFLHQILSGVDYLHKLGICHRDLKPENLLMDDFNNIKIVDFGLSNTYKEGESLQTACGSPCYAAPEMVAGKNYDGLAADMWSCGVIIYAMVCGFLPFEDPKTTKLYQKILNAEYEIPDFVSASCQDLIRKILCTDPKDRLNIEGIRAHPWYQQVKVREHHGIYVGKNPIPVDLEMITKVNDYETVDEEKAKTYVASNRHNSITTIYYLILKKHLRKGGKSIADITKYNPENFLPQHKGLARQLQVQQQKKESVEKLKLNFTQSGNISRQGTSLVGSLQQKPIVRDNAKGPAEDNIEDQAANLIKPQQKLVTQIKLKKEMAAPPLGPVVQPPPKDEVGEKSAGLPKLPDKQDLIQRSRINIEDINSQTQLKQSTKESQQTTTTQQNQQARGRDATGSPSPRSYFTNTGGIPALQKPVQKTLPAGSVPNGPTLSSQTNNHTHAKQSRGKEGMIQGQGGGETFKNFDSVESQGTVVGVGAGQGGRMTFAQKDQLLSRHQQQQIHPQSKALDFQIKRQSQRKQQQQQQQQKARYGSQPPVDKPHPRIHGQDYNTSLQEYEGQHQSNLFARAQNNSALTSYHETKETGPQEISFHHPADARRQHNSREPSVDNDQPFRPKNTAQLQEKLLAELSNSVENSSIYPKAGQKRANKVRYAKGENQTNKYLNSSLHFDNNLVDSSLEQVQLNFVNPKGVKGNKGRQIKFSKQPYPVKFAETGRSMQVPRTNDEVAVNNMFIMQNLQQRQGPQTQLRQQAGRNSQMNERGPSLGFTNGGTGGMDQFREANNHSMLTQLPEFNNYEGHQTLRGKKIGNTGKSHQRRNTNLGLQNQQNLMMGTHTNGFNRGRGASNNPQTQVNFFNQTQQSHQGPAGGRKQQLKGAKHTQQQQQNQLPQMNAAAMRGQQPGQIGGNFSQTQAFADQNFQRMAMSPLNPAGQPNQISSETANSRQSAISKLSMVSNVTGGKGNYGFYPEVGGAPQPPKKANGVIFKGGPLTMAQQEFANQSYIDEVKLNPPGSRPGMGGSSLNPSNRQSSTGVQGVSVSNKYESLRQEANRKQILDGSINFKNATSSNQKSSKIHLEQLPMPKKEPNLRASLNNSQPGRSLPPSNHDNDYAASDGNFSSNLAHNVSGSMGGIGGNVQSNNQLQPLVVTNQVMVGSRMVNVDQQMKKMMMQQEVEKRAAAGKKKAATVLTSKQPKK